jgi:hypothetical protein
MRRKLGEGRPPIEDGRETHSIGVRLTPHNRMRLTQIAKLRRVSVAVLAGDMLTEAIDQAAEEVKEGLIAALSAAPSEGGQ